jgi:hypothetical protein
MCPEDEIEDQTRAGFMARSDDYFLINATKYDDYGTPIAWVPYVKTTWAVSRQYNIGDKVQIGNEIHTIIS